MSETVKTQAVNPEQQQFRQELETYVERMFLGRREESGLRRGLEVTQSAEGDDRVRAFIPDEDGYAGWLEGASFVGAAKVQRDGVDKLIAERHFPHSKDKPTYFWEYDTSTGELLYRRENGAGETPGLDMMMPADQEYREYFKALARDLAFALQMHDYERDSRKAEYTFQLPQLV